MDNNIDGALHTEIQNLRDQGEALNIEADEIKIRLDELTTLHGDLVETAIRENFEAKAVVNVDSSFARAVREYFRELDRIKNRTPPQNDPEPPGSWA